jgi:hypothetical protein
MVYTVMRMMQREGVPAEGRRSRFQSLLRTSAFFAKLAGPGSTKEKP